MKPQDIIFMLILLILLWKKDPQYLVLCGLICLLLSIPLFHFWVFFTAERLVMYSAGFLLAALIVFWFTLRK